VNFKGKYNVPYGFRSKNFVDESALKRAQQALKNADLFISDFFETIDNVSAKDLIFLDPPYTVSHNNNGFIKYNEKLFSLDDQVRLSAMIDKIKVKNAYYILTNAAHSTIEKIFEKGDKKIKLNRANAIGGLKAERGQTTELVFTNLDI
jgi:DNA adenine methylase